MATKKTIKTTAASSAKKTGTSGTTAKAKKPTTGGAAEKATTAKYTPTNDEIRRKAEEIYHARIARGEAGTPEEDWHKAEILLKGSKK